MSHTYTDIIASDVSLGWQDDKPTKKARLDPRGKRLGEVLPAPKNTSVLGGGGSAVRVQVTHAVIVPVGQLHAIDWASFSALCVCTFYAYACFHWTLVSFKFARKTHGLWKLIPLHRTMLTLVVV